MPDLLDLLHRHFGHPDLRPPQIPIVDAVMEGVDVLAVMPTGSGKSLCFQLPALALPGLTLVVSPLISLMKDQVDELVKRGIGAAALHSGQTADERRDVLRRAHAGTLGWPIEVGAALPWLPPDADPQNQPQPQHYTMMSLDPETGGSGMSAPSLPWSPPLRCSWWPVWRRRCCSVRSRPHPRS